MMAAGALGVLALFLLSATLGELKGYQFIGSGVTATNTISVNGDGEVFAVPNTADIMATIQETAKDVKTAQDNATKKSNDVIAYLKGAGVDEKDIQTTDYSVNPQYSYEQSSCPKPLDGGPVIYCPPGRQSINGYQVSETLTVKVRDTSKAGDLLQGIGQRGISQVNGPNFTLDDADQKTYEAQARGKAIDDAHTKAEALAQQLGVHLVRVVGFSEGGGGPVYYAKAMSMDAGMAAPAPAAPEIAPGQNKITSNVSVTYEIQ